jgi:uncharacterized protein YeaO (DUF488 family)
VWIRHTVGSAGDRTNDVYGTRVLVDRLWPRGLTKAAAALDEWCKDVAPSAALRTWYNHDPQRFAEFARRYRAELQEPGAARAVDHLRARARHDDLPVDGPR